MQTSLPGLEILGEQASAAEEWLVKLEHDEMALDALVRERRDCFGFPTFSITLDEPSDQIIGARFTRNTSVRLPVRTGSPAR